MHKNASACSAADLDINRRPVPGMFRPQQVLRQRYSARTVIEGNSQVKGFPQGRPQIHAPPVRNSLPIHADAILDIQRSGVADSDARQAAAARISVGNGDPYRRPAVSQRSAWDVANWHRLRRGLRGFRPCR